MIARLLSVNAGLPRGINWREQTVRTSDAGLEKVTEICEAATIKPAVVHVESHPYLPEWELLDYCRRNGHRAANLRPPGS